MSNDDERTHTRIIRIKALEFALQLASREDLIIPEILKIADEFEKWLSK